MNVAFIPARGGSKSIPLKNIREIAGKPLIYWVAKAASDCLDIDRVYVATDSDKIKETVQRFDLEKVHVIGRSTSSATDTASTESVMLEFAEKYEFCNIVLIQATSPLLTAKDLSIGFSVYADKDIDSVLSVVRQKRFQWKVTENGFVKAVNYDIFHRPRRQEFDGYLVENGAFYITSRESLLKSKSRISGNIGFCEMSPDTYYEIDEPNDWLVIERQLEARVERDQLTIPKIKMFLTDCDGCLTDGGMYYSENGDELKKFSTLDGMGFRLLKEKGIISGIITGEMRELNYRRAKKIKSDIFGEGIQDKVAKVKELCKEHGINMQDVAYVGDDINDLEVIKEVGFGCCVQNGMEEVKKVAKYITCKKGGEGAVREVIDLILKK